jgi:hypothetical protein
VIDAAFGNWLSGFIDGEGGFHIGELKQRGYVSYACRFALTLRDDDSALIREIHRTMGFGRVRKAGDYGATNPALGWFVETKEDDRLLITFLERFPLRSKKARDLAIWSAAVDEWEKTGRHRGRCDWEPMRLLREHLMEQRRYLRVAA